MKKNILIVFSFVSMPSFGFIPPKDKMTQNTQPSSENGGRPSASRELSKEMLEYFATLFMNYITSMPLSKSKLPQSESLTASAESKVPRQGRAPAGQKGSEVPKVPQADTLGRRGGESQNIIQQVSISQSSQLPFSRGTNFSSRESSQKVASPSRETQRTPNNLRSGEPERRMAFWGRLLANPERDRQGLRSSPNPDYSNNRPLLPQGQSSDIQIVDVSEGRTVNSPYFGRRAEGRQAPLGSKDINTIKLERLRKEAEESLIEVHDVSDQIISLLQVERGSLRIWGIEELVKVWKRFHEGIVFQVGSHYKASLPNDPEPLSRGSEELFSPFIDRWLAHFDPSFKRGLINLLELDIPFAPLSENKSPIIEKAYENVSLMVNLLRERLLDPAEQNLPRSHESIDLWAEEKAETEAKLFRIIFLNSSSELVGCLGDILSFFASDKHVTDPDYKDKEVRYDRLISTIADCQNDQDKGKIDRTCEKGIGERFFLSLMETCDWGRALFVGPASESARLKSLFAFTSDPEKNLVLLAPFFEAMKDELTSSIVTQMENDDWEGWQYWRDHYKKFFVATYTNLSYKQTAIEQGEGMTEYTFSPREKGDMRYSYLNPYIECAISSTYVPSAYKLWKKQDILKNKRLEEIFGPDDNPGKGRRSKRKTNQEN